MWKIITETGNMKIIGEGAVSGLLIGGIGALFAASMDKENLTTNGTFFLNRNDDLAQPLQKLRQLLIINNNYEQHSRLEVITRKLNIIAGCDELTDDPHPYPIHLTYTVNDIAHSVTTMLNEIVTQKFKIPSLGIEICTCIEEIIEVIANIKHNVQQETNIRITNLGYHQP